MYGDRIDPIRDHRVKTNSTATLAQEYRMVSTWVDTDNECWSEPSKPYTFGMFPNPHTSYQEPTHD